VVDSGERSGERKVKQDPGEPNPTDGDFKSIFLYSFLFISQTIRKVMSPRSSGNFDIKYGQMTRFLICA